MEDVKVIEAFEEFSFRVWL